jgi:hypothetical protein
MKYFPKVVAIVLLGLASLAHQPVAAAAEPSPDAVLLERLAKSGSDLSKVHQIDFFLRFPSRKAAEHADSQLQDFAFATKTEPGKTGDEWTIQATKRMYPVESDLQGLRDKLELIATEGHGTYDGWQAKAVR